MADPTGGLARRAGYANKIARTENHPVLQVDAGNYFKPPGPNSDLINALMGESLLRFPMQVLNLTAGDLSFWMSRLSQDSIKPTRFISSNLVPLDEGGTAPQPYALFQWAGQELGMDQQFEVSFAGLAVPQRIRPNSGFRALEPEAAMERLEAAFWESNLQIVLTDLGVPEVTRLIEAYPAIDIVIRGERRFVLEEPQRIGQTWLVTAVERGRSLGQIDLVLTPQGTLESLTGNLIEMGTAIESDPFLAARESELLEKLP